MGCQTEIAKKIIERKADYVLRVKNNHKNLHKSLESWLDDMDAKRVDVNKEYYARRYVKFRTEETGHGRKEIRECLSITTVQWGSSFPNGSA